VITLNTAVNAFIPRILFLWRVGVSLIFDQGVVPCRYIKRRAREEFRKSPSQPVDLGSIQSQLDLVKRQGIVYSLYSRTAKSVMVCNEFLLVLSVMCFSHF
jgi:hypothetical protein